MERLQAMMYQNLRRIEELNRVAIDIEILTGLNLFELRDKLAAGWTIDLTPPDIKDKPTMVDLLSEFEDIFNEV